MTFREWLKREDPEGWTNEEGLFALCFNTYICVMVALIVACAFD